ncbi:hypothetical protein RHGRI_034105 [Rhododendron griersonianum]|uniref:Non-specific serine/threonine protein kinase n=1 Tax=Rhododendron griersonianum TaxID=479676 RepID=A0AAV6I061_9ERIC|nr:hypothetical protein RHGRI_034105 [Rhododendron griersonianum]
MLNHIHQWTRPLKRSWILFQKMLGFWLYANLIEDKNRRQVSFFKRRSGLMKKASELSVLCDVDIGLFIFSGRGLLHEFCSGDRIFAKEKVRKGKKANREFEESKDQPSSYSTNSVAGKEEWVRRVSKEELYSELLMISKLFSPFLRLPDSVLDTLQSGHLEGLLGMVVEKGIPRVTSNEKAYPKVVLMDAEGKKIQCTRSTERYSQVFHIYSITNINTTPGDYRVIDNELQWSLSARTPIEGISVPTLTVRSLKYKFVPLIKMEDYCMDTQGFDVLFAGINVGLKRPTNDAFVLHVTAIDQGFYPQFKTKIQCGGWHQLYCCCEINSLNVRGKYWLDLKDHFQMCFGQQWKLILKMVSNFQPEDRPFSPSIRQCLKLMHNTIGTKNMICPDWTIHIQLELFFLKEDILATLNEVQNMDGPTGRGTGAETPLQNYTIGKTLGHGSFGKVKITEHRPTGYKVAIKILYRRKMKSHNMEEKGLYEFMAIPFSVLFVQFHFCVFYSWEMQITVFRKYTCSDAIISGAEYCHRNMVVHRDLKPENLLLHSRGNVQIDDFGLSNVMRDDHFLKTICGSPNYAAPEVVSGKLYAAPEIDVWSCGVILYSLLCGTLPFDDENIPNLFKKIKGGVYTLPSHLSHGARDLILRMLVVDPMKQITIPEIRQHLWFKTRLPCYLAVQPPDPVLQLVNKACFVAIDFFNFFYYVVKEELSILEELQFSRNSGMTILGHFHESELLCHILLINFVKRKGIAFYDRTAPCCTFCVATCTFAVDCFIVSNYKLQPVNKAFAVFLRVEQNKIENGVIPSYGFTFCFMLIMVTHEQIYSLLVCCYF